MRSLCTECCCCCCWGWGLVAAKPALLEPLLKRLLPWSAESCGACPARCCHRLLRSGSLTSVLLPPTRSPRSSPATAGTELPGLLVPRARTPISCSLLGPPPLLGPSKKPAPGGSSRWEAKVPGTLTTLELSETDCIRARLCEGKGVARTRVWLSNMEEAAGVCTRLSGGEGVVGGMCGMTRCDGIGALGASMLSVAAWPCTPTGRCCCCCRCCTRRSTFTFLPVAISTATNKPRSPILATYFSSCLLRMGLAEVPPLLPLPLTGSRANMMFSGFMSLWMSMGCRLCKYCIASATSTNHCTASARL
mmetsp:Transcript_18661/g.48603  ORF Transcript_18661/g.48603 Transcript_18661/m.48603 type:complete len:306 (+) Transcript_18661:314-1231(+)